MRRVQEEKGSGFRVQEEKEEKGSGFRRKRKQRVQDVAGVEPRGMSDEPPVGRKSEIRTLARGASQGHD